MMCLMSLCEYNVCMLMQIFKIIRLMANDSGHISIYAHAIHKAEHFLQFYNNIGTI